MRSRSSAISNIQDLDLQSQFLIPQRTSRLKSALESKKNFMQITDYSMQQLESPNKDKPQNAKQLLGHQIAMGDCYVSPFKKKKKGEGVSQGKKDREKERERDKAREREGEREKGERLLE